MGYTFIDLDKDEQEANEKSHWKLWLMVFIFAVLTVCLLRWGGYLLVAEDPVPEHVDAAVVLQGSIASESGVPPTESQSACRGNLIGAKKSLKSRART
jgi:hypothetical protein